MCLPICVPSLKSISGSSLFLSLSRLQGPAAWSVHLCFCFCLHCCPGHSSLPSVPQAHTPSRHRTLAHAVASAWPGSALFHLLHDNTCLSSNLNPSLALKPFREPSHSTMDLPITITAESWCNCTFVFVVIRLMSVSSMTAESLSAFAHSCVPSV